MKLRDARMPLRAVQKFDAAVGEQARDGADSTFAVVPVLNREAAFHQDLVPLAEERRELLGPLGEQYRLDRLNPGLPVSIRLVLQAADPYEARPVRGRDQLRVGRQPAAPDEDVEATGGAPLGGR